MAISVSRISDRKFQFSTELNKKKLRFSLKVDGQLLNAETRYHIASKAARQILANYTTPSSSSKRFRYGEKTWKISRVSLPWWQKILTWLLPKFAFQPPKDDYQFRVKQGWGKVKKIKKSLSDPAVQAAKHEWKRKSENPYSYGNYKRLKKEFNTISPEQYRKGVRGAVTLSHLHGKQASYADPFTQLATYAFQKYESDYVAHDRKTPQTTDYRLIKEGDQLLLVHRESSLITEENMKEALDAYRQYIHRQYGAEKVEYINHLYRLQLEMLNGETPNSALAPEHVYRFNIGTLNIEMQDVQDCVKNLRQLYHDTKEIDSNTPLTALCEKIPGQQFNGLYRLLQTFGNTDIPDLGTFHAWISAHQGLNSLSNQTFRDILTIVKPIHEEIKRSYTGRKIHGIIQSGYTTADWSEFKPWIDQQELTQTMEDIIITNPDWTDYLETLSHVVAKKHLERRHKQEGYRVGALIPAPAPSPGDPTRWYRVTSSVTNGGIHSYTLESAIDDPTLPTIKLYRSTATSPAAMGSDTSVKNNLNFFNSPGKRGIKWLEQYEKPFFQERSIPIWVGYQYQAEQLLNQSDSDLNEMFKLLKSANQSLYEATAHQHRTKTFREILKEHDSILDELFLKGRNILPHSRKTLELSSFARICGRLIKRYARLNLKKVNDVPAHIVHKDAQNLYDELCILHDIETDQCTKAHMAALINDLQQHVLHPASSSEFSEFNDRVYLPLKEMENRIEELLKKGRTVKAREALDIWSQQLMQYAQSQGEDIASKLSQDLIFTGHSLGGACAQVGLVHYITNERRIPLPGRKCSGYFYDDPKINQEDNRQFKDFGNQHASLLNSLGIRFEIIRREEAGDIVPLGGEQHLGAAFTTREEAKLNQWLRFDAAVNERLGETSQHTSIANSEWAHGTRFGGGRRLGAHTLSTPQQGLPDFRQIHYSPKIQGIFDRRGLNTDLSPKRAKEIYQHLHKRIWKIPGVLEAVLREEVRKSLSFITLYIRKLLFWLCGVSNNSPPSKWVDDFGVLAVTTSGVVSKKILSTA